MIMEKRRDGDSMRIIEVKNYDQACSVAADIISAHLIMKKNSVLGLATGSTPLGVYQNLVQKYRMGILDFSECKTVNLDEYIGLEPDNEHSYAYYMWNNFFKHINISKQNAHIPRGFFSSSEKPCEDFDNRLFALGRPDIQLLGLGHNGHIGFNEPDVKFSRSTHIVRLSERTKQANARFFNKADEMPSEAITMGILDIMKAVHILLLVSDKSKMGILKKALEGDIDPQVPASILQVHQNVTVVVNTDT